jgi:hypothetical protein
MRYAQPALGLVLWGAFTAWCLSGFPPCIDLPVHGAQMQTLADLLRGGPAAQVFTAHLSIGYGLTTWLFLPVAMLFNGAVAVKVAAWLSLTGLPVTVGLLAHRLGRPWQVAALAAPLGFSVSYWYGFLPTFFAGPLVVLAWATLLGLLKAPSRRGGVTLLVLSLVVLLCHFMAYAALAAGAAALVLSSIQKQRWRALALVAAPGVLAVARVVDLLGSAASGTAALPTKYNLDAHLLGVVKQYPLGARISVWLNAVVLLLIGLWAAWRWWKTRQRDPALWLLASQVGLFAVMPDDLAGSWRVGVRLVVFFALAALCTWPTARVPKGLYVVPVVSLICLGHLHVWFEREVAGLEALITTPPPGGIHGGLLLTNAAPPHTRLFLLEHQAQWWTARWGGVGTHIFADASHQPVQYRRDPDVPLTVRATTLEPAPLDAVLVYGEGALPPELEAHAVVGTSGRWRRVERR